MQPSSAIPLVVITAGALFMPWTARRLHLPVAVAEIVYGVIIGGSGLGLVQGDAFIHFLADLGFAFFMFLAGLELDFRGFERRGRLAGLPALLQCSASFLLAFFLGQRLGLSLWLSLAAGAISVPLMVTVLREAGVNGTRFANTLVGLGGLGEGLTILILSVLHLHHISHGGWPMLEGLLKMSLLVVAVVFLLFVFRALLWWFPQLFTMLVEDHDPSEVGVRAGFGLMFAFVGLSMILGVEPFLGAFIAGGLMTFIIREMGALEHKLAAMAYGFFVPVFFIHVGMSLELNLDILATHGPLIIAILGLMLVIKLIPALIQLTAGYYLNEVLAMSLLLASPLTLVIAVVDIGLREGVLTNEEASYMVLAGILASLLYPVLAKVLLRRGARPA
jgi:Kef-type K+ transport system membrane component KefB